MFLISAGRLFHSLGAADWKARSPSVGRHRALAGTNTVVFLDQRLYLLRLYLVKHAAKISKFFETAAFWVAVSTKPSTLGGNWWITPLSFYKFLSFDRGENAACRPNFVSRVLSASPIFVQPLPLASKGRLGENHGNEDVVVFPLPSCISRTLLSRRGNETCTMAIGPLFQYISFVLFPQASGPSMNFNTSK